MTMTDEIQDSDGEAPAIERLGPNHVGSAKALIRDVWREHFASHGDAFVRNYLLLPDALDDLDDAVAGRDAGSLFLVQQLRGHVVATGAIRAVTEDVCELSRMFVARDWRKRGLATTLAHRLLAFARTTHFTTVRLASNKQLTASHQLYHVLGFRACPGSAPEDDRHSITMQLSL
jgi:GNAT superfamily N-acetyltransferase